MYIAIDPGKTTGYALFSAKGEVVKMAKVEGEDRFLDLLEELVEEYSFSVAVVEEYRNRPNMKHNLRSTNVTSQHIGAITRILRKNKITIVMQAASPALVIGLKFLGMSDTYKGKHVPDDVSALAHGTYYLRKAKVI